MAIDFPGPPLTVGQKHPTTPVEGVPTYTWDGEKWITGISSTSGVFVAKAGDTMTGALVLPADPTAALEAATKQYVDGAAGGGFNYAINGDMYVAQRATSFSNVASGTYTLDRYFTSFDGSVGTYTISQTPLAANELANFGVCLRWNQTGSGGSSFRRLLQLVEDITKFANKTMTISFYAKGAANFTMSVSLDRQFGLGGSPSASDVATLVGNNTFAVTTTWQRFQAVFNIGSIAGKTLGTTPNTSGVRIRLDVPPAAAFDLYMTGVKLEEGSVATPFIPPDRALEMHRCMRYYERTDNEAASQSIFAINNGCNPIWDWLYQVTKRATPTVSYFGSYTPNNTTNSFSIQPARSHAGIFQSQTGALVCYWFMNANSGWIADAEMPIY